MAVTYSKQECGNSDYLQEEDKLDEDPGCPERFYVRPLDHEESLDDRVLHQPPVPGGQVEDCFEGLTVVLRLPGQEGVVNHQLLLCLASPNDVRLVYRHRFIEVRLEVCTINW